MPFSFRLSLCLLALNLSPVDAALGQSQPPSSALSIRYSARGKTVAFGLSALGLLQVDSRAQGSASEPLEEAALRLVIEKYFSAYGKKDLAGVVALWSEKSPDLATYKQGLQQQFTSEELSFGSPAISGAKVEGEKASLRVTDCADIHSNLKSRQKSEQVLANNLELIKEGVEWKLWRYASAAEELAVALVNADTKAELEALLAKEKELVGIELGRALLAQGQRLKNRGSYQRAIDISKLALDIAEQAGDKGVAAGALRGVGNVQLSQGNYTEALEQYHKSVRISEEIARQGRHRQIAEQHRDCSLLGRQLRRSAGAVSQESENLRGDRRQGRHRQIAEQHRDCSLLARQLPRSAGAASEESENLRGNRRQVSHCQHAE